jgi:hypothetical protein
MSPELEQSLLGPKLFFFNRCVHYHFRYLRPYPLVRQRNTNLTPEAVQEYTRTRPQPTSPSSSTPPSANLIKTPDEDQQLSLAELTRLIESGQTHLIPHNYVIPDGVQASPHEPIGAQPTNTP